jgi:uncharacterized protein (DUF302 family)
MHERQGYREPGSSRCPATTLLVGLLSLLMLTAQAPAPGGGASGLVAKRSQYSVAETMDRLERAAKDRDFVVVARVDHAGAAQRAGLTLRPAQLLIFGNPRGGTPLMQSAPTAGIDLPLRALAWEDSGGQIWLAYNDPSWLALRHGVQDRAEVIKAMTAVLEALTDAAAKGAR